MRLEKLLHGYVVILLLVLLVSFFTLIALVTPVQAECPATDYDCQIRELQIEYDSRKDAHEKNKTTLAQYEKELASLNSKITALEASLKLLEKKILNTEVDLGVQEEILAAKVHSYYINSKKFSPFLLLLSSKNASELVRELSFRQQAASRDRKIITSITENLSGLNTDKQTLEKTKISLASLKAQSAKQTEFMRQEVAKTESFFAQILAKQQAILAAKAGSFITSVGDIELADDYKASIKGFREAAPSGSFAVFSFGGYTHRLGMSQYGARGRAENGQDYKQILKAYYGKEPVNKDTSGTIIVNGSPMDFEGRYLFGIAEMPSNWNMNALKAQAVAARTYAYRYKVGGKSICTTQSCQVFSSSKANNPPSSWKQAVEETRGQVLEDVVTYYSSTAGGYSFTNGWDTFDGNGGGDFVSRAWENKGGSPWLYKAWYRAGYTSTGATCGKDNPWLTGEDLADIVNAALVLKNRNDDRIISVVSCSGGNPYSRDELKNAASSYGGISSVSSISVLQGNGVTNEIVVNGSIRISGIEFKNAFNVRASGSLKIPQGKGFGSSTDFAFFNIEKK